MDADPASGSGIKAAPGSIAFGNVNGGTKIYIKNGASDTGWDEFHQGLSDIDAAARLETFDTTTGYSTVNTINGTTHRLSHDNSLTRYAEKTLSISSKFRGKNLYLTLDLITTASSGNFKVIITDETNSSAELVNEVLTPQTGSLPIKRSVYFDTASNTASIKVRFEALAQSGSVTTDFDDVVISLTKTETIEVTAIEQDINEFSARIANDGTATVTSQSYPFIASVSRTGLGVVQVTFVSGFFTEIPAITLSVESTGGERWATYESLSTTGLTVLIDNTAGTNFDLPFSIKASRQGSDYRNLTRRVERELSTFKEVIVEEADSMIRLHTANGYGSTATKIRRFSTIVQNLGDAITYDDTAANGASFIINKSGNYSINYCDTASGDTSIGISKNSTQLTTEIYSITAADRLAVSDINGGSSFGEVSWTGYLEAGDIIRPHHSNSAAFYVDAARTSFTISHQGSLKKAIISPDSKIEIPTSEVRYEGTTGKGTGAEAFTVAYQTLAKIRGDAFSVSNSNGTVVTVLKDGFVTVNADARIGGTLRFGVSLNTADASTYPTNSEAMINEDNRGAASNDQTSCNASFWVNAGDVIRVWSDGSILSTTANGRLILTHQEQKISVAVSNVTPQYEDTDSCVRLNTGNGTGSTNTFVRRFANLESNIGSDVVYADSATLGSSFTIQKDGIYHISFTDQASGGGSLGIMRNSVEQPNGGSTPAQRLAMASWDTVDGDYNSVSWSGLLSAGDIIRPTVFNVSSASTRTSFSISRVGVPSIAEVDVTPFADVNRPIRESARFYKHQGYGSTANKIPYFSFQPNSTFNELGTINNSPVNGFSFTATKKCKVTAAYSVKAVSGNACYAGFTLNATSSELTQTVDVVDASKVLGISRGPDGAHTVSTVSIIMEAGDVLRPHAGYNQDSSLASLTITAESDSRSSMYSVAQVENEFSARIANNGTATITSQSSEFISSVSRTSLGLVQINFVPGFFTEVPAIQVTDDSSATQMSNSTTGSVTTSSAVIETYNEGASAYQDRNFSILVSRQGADRKDLQKAIVSLNEFPRVNKVISQQISHNSAGSTLLDRTGQIRFNTSNLINSGSSILLIEDDTGNTRTKFTALKDCRVSLTFNGRITSAGGFQVDVYKNNSLVQRGNNSDGAGSSAFVSYTAKILKGDYITLATNGDSIENSAELCQLNILAEAEDLEVVTNIDAHENVFSARITSAGAVTTKNYDWIDSITKGAAGIYTINLKAGFFTVAPAVEGIVETNSDSTFTAVPSTTSIIIEINSGGAKTDRNFSIFVQRQGDDYKSIQDVVAQVFIPKVAYIKEIQSSSVASSTTLTSATFVKNTLNTVSGSSEIVSLSASAFTLQPGTYDISLNIPTYVNSSSNTVAGFQGRLRNTTNNTTPIVTNHASSRGSGTTAGHIAMKDLYGEERIILTIPTTFEVQTRVNTTTNTAASIGSPQSTGENEVYTQVKIVQVY